MKKNEKIGIAIVIILVIVLVLILWSNWKNVDQGNNRNCEVSCHKIASDSWTFLGAGPVNQNTYYTQEECISACQARFRR